MRPVSDVRTRGAERPLGSTPPQSVPPSSGPEPSRRAGEATRRSPQAGGVDPRVTPTRYLTAGIPPIGGRLKERPTDFFVEEIPLVQPAGHGDYIYLMVEKVGLPTMEMATTIAKHFGVERSAVGLAGLKDKQAVTRQVVSVHAPGRRVEEIPHLRDPRLRVLWADYHTERLRRGHLAGNRFNIRVRGVEITAALHAKRVLSRLAQTGVPNRVGEQRFGFLMNNHLIGRALYLGDVRSAVDMLLAPHPNSPEHQVEARRLYAEGDYARASRAFPRHFRTESILLRYLAKGEEPEEAWARLDAGIRGFYYSAFQSAVFNAVLDRRLEAGTLAALLPGDLAFGNTSRELVAIDESNLHDPELERLADRLELGPSGPMWGHAMRRAGGQVDQAEVSCLAEFGMRPADLEHPADEELDITAGTRRPLRVPITNIDVEGGVDEHGSYVRCAFDLPRGSFATTVMREVMKPERMELIEEE
mgnify:CR=1 FL=1